MQMVVSESRTVTANVLKCQKAYAPSDDESGNDKANQGIRTVGSQGRIGLPCPHQIKACVAKGRHGMNESHPQALPQSHFGTKTQGQKERSRQFHTEHNTANEARSAYNACQLRSRYGFLHDPAKAKAYFLAGQDSHGNGHGHNTKATGLYEQKNDELPKERPVLHGVVHNQTSHSDGRRGCEQRISKARSQAKK